MFYSEEMIKELILEHTKRPRNINKKHDNYYECTLKNPSCGDIVTLYLDIKDNIINDVTYNIEGCSISTSSISIMSDLIKGKTTLETRKIIEQFEYMITGKEYDEDILRDANCLKGVVNVPPRIKCASLGYKALLEIIKEV